MFIDHCLICDAVLNTTKNNAGLCPTCLSLLEEEQYDTFMARCPVCFYPIVSSEYRCPRCLKSGLKEGAFPIYCVSTYDGDLSYSVLQRFKFHDDKRLARVVGYMLNKALDILDPSKTAVIVPIPCSKKSLKKRGWDQMKEVSKYLNRKVLSLLVNTSNSSTQQKLLDRSQRLGKINKRFDFNNAYKLEEALKALKNRSLILIDDVSTTFSTLTAAQTYLNSLGFESVKGAVWLYDLKAEKLGS